MNYIDLKQHELLDLLIKFFQEDDNADRFEDFVQRQEIELLDFDQVEEDLEIIRDELKESGD